MLRKNPGFSLIAILTLTLGIGVNTTIFSVVNALLLRPLPYRQPEQLVKVFQMQPDPKKGMMPSIWSYPRFALLRDHSRSLAAVAAVRQNPHNLTGTDAPERLQVEMVSASYFPLFGVDAIVGRTFTPDEDAAPGANLVALLSHGLWQRRFGGAAQIIGKTLELDNQAFIIVGVLPPGFRGQDGTADAWVTMMAAPALRYKSILNNGNNYWLAVIGRLKDGVSPAQANADLQQVSAQIEQLRAGVVDGAVVWVGSRIAIFVRQRQRSLERRRGRFSDRPSWAAPTPTARGAITWCGSTRTAAWTLRLCPARRPTGCRLRWPDCRMAEFSAREISTRPMVSFTSGWRGSILMAVLLPTSSPSSPGTPWCNTPACRRAGASSLPEISNWSTKRRAGNWRA
jgi:hypothetical protein